LSAKSVDEYIAARPETARAVLRRVRRAIRTALPDAQETLSYDMPTYKVGGKTVLHFAGWKNHYSVYPANAQVVAAFGRELADYTIEKSTLKLSYEAPVPVALIARIAKFRRQIVRQADAIAGRRPAR
jgi:uncharacterized protein YdhG (YjbR/CyaY superfamily)